MAVIIRSEEHIKHEGGIAVIRAEIDVDLQSELPVPPIVDGKKLCAGSTALILTKGELAILSSDNKWRNCSGAAIKG